MQNKFVFYVNKLVFYVNKMVFDVTQLVWYAKKFVLYATLNVNILTHHCIMLQLIWPQFFIGNYKKSKSQSLLSV